ncbi:alpha/beta hydrolase [Paenibacillus sp. GCM10023252]|uniref:alpha/beta hydrolase n=1 Tax=Paenibacillus sp. GCM10023252 TaxID=3252649 RepID=UPI0036160659
MAMMQCQFFSEVLSLNTTMTVILPQQTSNQIGMEGKQSAGRERKHPVLYLLHGYSDDDSIWLRRTSIERYAAALGIAVVMPQVHQSFYTDMAYGNRYWTFLSEELPALARSFFPLSEAREDNFVAGLSMGGYGAFKWALRHPNRFAAAASLSGALDMAHPEPLIGLNPSREPLLRLIFGEKAAASGEDDLLWLLEQSKSADADSRAAASGSAAGSSRAGGSATDSRAMTSGSVAGESATGESVAVAGSSMAGGKLPMLYQCCGTEDFLYGHNVAFRDACLAAGTFELTYEEGPGNHEWGYWDRKIQDVLAWLPIRRG